MDGSPAGDRPGQDADGGEVRQRSAQSVWAARPVPTESNVPVEEAPEPDIVPHSVGDDEEEPWCIGVSAAR
jgi:hypothetical protein